MMVDSVELGSVLVVDSWPRSMAFLGDEVDDDSLVNIT